MREKWAAGAIFGVLVCCAACDDDGDDPYAALPPAANIDIDTCSSIAAEENEKSLTCFDCCLVGGYDSFTGHDGQCVCGQSLHYGDNDTICDAQRSSGELCNSCCKDAGFHGDAWLGGPEGSCTCLSNGNAEVCAPAWPEASCHACCLHHGFLSVTTMKDGAPACICQ
jgi:hypothetical protein